MSFKNRLTEMLKISYPIIQGPFGAHGLSPQQIVSTVQEIKTKTNKPFAMNLWVSNVDPQCASINQGAFNKVVNFYKDFFCSCQRAISQIFRFTFGYKNLKKHFTSLLQQFYLILETRVFIVHF